MMGLQEVASHGFTGGTWKLSKTAPWQGDGIHVSGFQPKT